MIRRTVIVEGPLAFRMRRIAAARRAEAGVQIMTLPQLAARLAGGFAHPAGSADLYPAIRSALDAGGFTDLESIRSLPGMTRSAASTLSRLWDADFSLAGRASENPRLEDLATIEARACAGLAAGTLTPRDLRDAALKRVEHAPAVLGPIELDRVVHVAPVWRPLLDILARTVPLRWRHSPAADVSWFVGDLTPDGPLVSADAPEIISCATPRAEVIEALRWTRELIACGHARPDEIAICATATDDWDAHMLVLAADAELPVYFSHGVPALASRDGQACAALADVLINGLSQDRVRRLFRHAAGHSPRLKALPPTWAQGLRSGAALFELEQWRRALDEAQARRADAVDVRPLVTPVIELLTRGPDAADEAGALLLGSAAQTLWMEALRRAPAQALEFSLQELRRPDDRDPGACAVWCPASHLAAAPRPFVRLLGMTTRSWPRRASEDPLLPTNILSRQELGAESVTDQDRCAFEVITAYAIQRLVLSRSRRNAQGGLQAASPLVPQGMRTIALKRARIPSHAFSEADRLLARPGEAAASPSLRAADACWHNWQRPRVTGHDGRVRADHPIIVRAIDEVQSATRLRLMLRDPLAYVWRYALGWRSLLEDEQPLTLDARGYGELVHEMLKRTVDALEPKPGYARAARHEIEAALDAASAHIGAHWPLERSAPPLLLWQHTLAAARDLALKALTLDEAFQPNTRSWTELEFGREGERRDVVPDLLWSPTAQVVIPGTGVRIRGTIDRVDYNSARNGVRISDYKTGAEPPKADEIVLGRGAELQRVLYALAALQLVPDHPRVIARLVFLSADQPRPYRLHDIDQAVADVGTHVAAAIALIRRGIALPGPDARESWNDFALALPASPATYFAIKRSAFDRLFGDAAQIWGVR